MWKRLTVCVLVCITLLFGGTCSDNGDGGSSSGDGQIPIFDCTSLSLKGAFAFFERLFKILVIVNNQSITHLSGVSFNHMTGEFNFDLDLFGDAWTETHVTGTVTGDDYSDGLQQGEVAIASFKMLNDAADSIGGGTFSFYEFPGTYDIFRMTITEETSMITEDPCEIEFTGFGIHIDLPVFDPYDPDTTLYTAIYTGIIEFTARTAADRYLTGLLTFDGTEIALISLVYNNTSYEGTLNLKTFELSVSPVRSSSIVMRQRNHLPGN